MSSSCKILGLLTTPQASVLKKLYDLNCTSPEGTFWKAKDVGAYRSSHHSLTLRKLCELGLVEKLATSKSFGYRIANAGQSCWNLLLEAAQLPAVMIIGGQATKHRTVALARVTR